MDKNVLIDELHGYSTPTEAMDAIAAMDLKVIAEATELEK